MAAGEVTAGRRGAITVVDHVFDGLGTHVGNLSRLSNARTRSISAENRTGAPGEGGRATEGTGAIAARELGQGWKVSPSINIAGNETVTLAGDAGQGHGFISGDVDRRRDLPALPELAGGDRAGALGGPSTLAWRAGSVLGADRAGARIGQPAQVANMRAEPVKHMIHHSDCSPATSGDLARRHD